jgi:putative transcriptional regulator
MFGATAIFVVCAVLVPAMRTAWETMGAKVTSFFLVASPDLSDPLFQRSVILMLPPTQIPLAGGIIINKPTTVPLPKPFSRRPRAQKPGDRVFGGPVEITELLAPARLCANRKRDSTVRRRLCEYRPRFHRQARQGRSARRRPALLLGTRSVDGEPTPRWDLVGAWYVVPADADLVFSPDPGRIWRILVERAQLHEADVTCVQGSSAAAPSCCTGELAWSFPQEFL